MDYVLFFMQRDKKLGAFSSLYKYLPLLTYVRVLVLSCTLLLLDYHILADGRLLSKSTEIN